MMLIWIGALSLATGSLDIPPVGALPADTMIQAGDLLLEIEVRRGSAPLTILFESGGGTPLDAWATVPDSVAARTGATVVTYNRAGIGGSPLGSADLVPADEVRAIVSALDALGVPGRRLVVGTSYGGMLAVLHAALYPDAVAGLLLVDPMNSRFIEATGDFVRSTVPATENPANDRERLIARMSATLADLTARTAEAEPALPIPIVVITAGEPWWGREDIVAAWRKSHAEIVGARHGRELVVAEGSDHDVAEERPDTIVDAVDRLIDEARVSP